MRMFVFFLLTLRLSWGTMYTSRMKNRPGAEPSGECPRGRNGDEMRIFCGKNCKDGWREDRAHGLIYPSYRVTYCKTGQTVSVSRFAYMLEGGCCPTCGADVVKFRRTNEPAIREACKRFGETFSWPEPVRA